MYISCFNEILSANVTMISTPSKTSYQIQPEVCDDLYVFCIHRKHNIHPTDWLNYFYKACGPPKFGKSTSYTLKILSKPKYG